MKKTSVTQTRWVLPLIFVLLIAVDLFVYAGVRNHPLVNYDDPAYVGENTMVQGGLNAKGLVWAFTTDTQMNWHPLTWLSHMLDIQLFGMNVGMHHLTNLFFHIANTLLLFWVFYRMTQNPWRSAFVAALFGVHPAHVQSVAWVSERKDVLSGLFWLLTMLAYVAYARKPEWKRYLLVFLALALGLMAKPMLVMTLARTDEALHHFNEALRLDPLNARAHNNLAGALTIQGKMDEAIREYSEALRINPGYAEARRRLELLLGKQAQ